MSRIDYGSEGFRKALLEAAAEIFIKEDVGFVALLGGLVATRELREKRLIPPDPAGYALFVREMSDELKQVIPKMRRRNGELIKIYIVTSPAYDGDLGKDIARELVRGRKRREDILVWHEGNDRFPMKGSGKIIWGMTPERNVWMRGDYYSTFVQRMLRDLQKRSTQRMANRYIAGCCGSALNKPYGEEPKPYTSLPVLHKIRETTLAENQVGVAVLDTSRESDQVTFYSMKDLLAQERSFVPVPEDIGEEALNAVNAIKAEGGMTIGQLSDRLNIGRKRLKTILKPLMEEFDDWPGIHRDESSGKYDFNLRWIQHSLRYNFSKMLASPTLKEDRIVAFGCMHAGSIHTDYQFFTQTLPAYLIEQRADILVGAGDFIEGLKHDLMLRGETIGNANYSKQEKWAAQMVARVILKVFRYRLNQEIQSLSTPSLPALNEMVPQLINKCLMQFIFIPGNHCDWSTDYGFRSLDTFQSKLILLVFEGVQKALSRNNLFCSNALDMVQTKIFRGERYETSSGLRLAVIHPYLGRTKTQSIRVQETFRMFPDANVIISANFHVGIYVQEHTPEMGERQGLQVGTIKIKSSFEHHKLKEPLDFGVGLLILRSLDGRIISATNEFFGIPVMRGSFNNEKMLDQVFEELTADKPAEAE